MAKYQASPCDCWKGKWIKKQPVAGFVFKDVQHIYKGKEKQSFTMGDVLLLLCMLFATATR